MSKQGKHPHQLSDLAHVKQFVTGGNATLTLKSKVSGKRFTYNLRQILIHKQTGTVDGRPVYEWCKSEGRFDVKVLGPHERYQWIGSTTDGKWNPGRNHSKAESVKAFEWFWRRLYTTSDAWMAQVEVWHEGTSRRWHC